MRKGCSSKVDVSHSFITRKFSVLSLFSCESWRNCLNGPFLVLKPKPRGKRLVQLRPFRMHLSPPLLLLLHSWGFKGKSSRRTHKGASDTSDIRCYPSTPLLLVSSGDKISQTCLELFHTASFPSMSPPFPAPPWTPLFFTVWRATLTINMSLCRRGSVSEKGSE